MMGLLFDGSEMNPWLLSGLLILIVAVSIVFLIFTIEFRIRLKKGDFEENIKPSEEKEIDD